MASTTLGFHAATILLFFVLYTTASHANYSPVVIVGDHHVNLLIFAGHGFCLRTRSTACIVLCSVFAVANCRFGPPIIPHLPRVASSAATACTIEEDEEGRMLLLMGPPPPRPLRCLEDPARHLSMDRASRPLHVIPNGDRVMDPMDEHDSDELPLGVASDEAHVAFRARNKKRSRVWDEYKPIYVNGAIQSAECRYCHILMSCKGSDGHSNGTSHLWRHQKICRAKEELELTQLQDTGFPYVVNDINPVDQIHPDSLDDINLASHSDNSRFRSKVWEEFRPVFVEGRIQSAECIHCHKLLSADKGRSHLNRHTQTCPVRGETGTSNKKGLFSPSSVPSFKSGVQDELSPALTNGKVQIAEYASKLLKGNSSVDKTPLSQHILALPARDNMTSKEQNTSSTRAAPDGSTRKFDQETSYQELTRMIVLHGYPLSIVEHEEMKRFARSLNPLFNMASIIDVEEYLTLLYQKEKADLKEKIELSSRRVSLSASIWAPHGAEPTVKYICLTAHFVDAEWKLQRKIIKFGVFWCLPTDLERMILYKEACILESASGPYNAIGEAIRDWNLDNKLFSLISVSEIRNHGGTMKLKDMLIQRNSLPIRGELYNIACVDDVLNNIVSKVQSMLHLIDNVLERFMLAHGASSLTQQQLFEAVTNMGLKCPQEDAKWWHKIYFRLEVVLHCKKVFLSEELLPAEDYKIVESICKILRSFYRAIEVISGPVCPTANMYFNELWKVRTTLQEEASTDHTELASM
ncbi:hypothetical protein E2562_000440, partial [Oryza meyeriana var. granulata]